MFLTLGSPALTGLPVHVQPKEVSAADGDKKTKLKERRTEPRKKKRSASPTRDSRSRCNGINMIVSLCECLYNSRGEVLCTCAWMNSGGHQEDTHIPQCAHPEDPAASPDRGTQTFHCITSWPAHSFTLEYTSALETGAEVI